MLLASEGVCVIGNLNELKNNQIEELENVVQTECVSIDLPKKYIVCQQSLVSVPVTCKTWACCERMKKQGTRAHKTPQNIQDCAQLSKTLVDNFSLVFIMTENEVASSELFAETLIVQNILERACDKIEQEISRIPDNEFLEVFYYLMLHPIFLYPKLLFHFVVPTVCCVNSTILQKRGSRFDSRILPC